ncbi:ankyrin repeat containing protein [Penicillium malachiteum]|uniref:ankyrin repeat containing protein n=1 Tax=Penicillium malachiteum TaxID=1324776 RepID=UPI002547C4E6|nr:ankyrin repeat containing protein [Penicillium malachiteum]KAJ5715265.1 ankyrin repeat containing protein [Penicillium malachiteum]
MDPLSFTASLLAVATLAASVTTALSNLRHVGELPGRLHAINNEVTDLEVILRQIGSKFTETHSSPLRGNPNSLLDVLRRAESKLRELDAIVARLMRSCVRNGKFLVRAKVWMTEKPKLQAFQEELHDIKATLNLILGLVHSQDMMRVQLDLQNISLVSTKMTNAQIVFRNEINSTIEQNTHRVDERLAALERALNEQLSRLQLRVSSDMGTYFRSQGANSMTTSLQQYQKSFAPSHVGLVRIRAAQYIGRACEATCRCACHQRFEYHSPSLVGPVVGKLFFGYAGFPRIRRNCDDLRCSRSKARHISIEYWFPLWFLSGILMLILSLQQSGPALQLRLLRRVPDAAQCIDFARTGNIEGIKLLFKEGLASPFDVSQSRNFSMLRYETCRFLLEAGSGPNQAGASAMMWDFVLWATLNDSEMETVTTLLAGSDFVDDQKFPMVHKIILKLSGRSLENEVLHNLDAVFETDARGRTALSWAAARGDERSMIALLACGADPNAMDQDDPISPQGTPTRTPPLVLIGQFGDLLALKTIQDFNPNIEARTHALLLLERNANPNAMMNDGKTPLTAAITYNNKGVLKVLLNSWNKYITCPRLAGPNLLDVVADFADIETILILAMTEHLRFYSDKQYVLASRASERIRKRPDASEKLIAAFDELVTHVKGGYGGGRQQLDGERVLEARDEFPGK